MISQHVLEKCITRLALLPFFPSRHEERIELSDMIEEFAETDEQVDWLGRRMRVLYQEWPGPRELRACFCSRYKPKDGISVCSGKYAEGIPSEAKEERKLLPPGRGEPVSADPVLAAAVVKAAEVMTIPPVSRRRQQVAQQLATILEPPKRIAGEPAPQVIKPEDVARAVRENRERRARGVVEFWKGEPDGNDN